MQPKFYSSSGQESLFQRTCCAVFNYSGCKKKPRNSIGDEQTKLPMEIANLSDASVCFVLAVAAFANRRKAKS